MFDKPCRDCRWFTPAYTYSLSPACRTPQRIELDGESYSRFSASAREDTKDCGPSGRWFEPKLPKKGWWEWITQKVKF